MVRLPAWLAPLLAGVMLVGVVAGCASQQPATPLPTPSAIARISGADLFSGRAPLAGGVPCATCHTLDPHGRAGVGPNLAGIGRRAGARIPGLNAREYLERSIRVHDEFVVPSHQAGIVRAVVGDEYGNLLPDEQIAALVDFLLQQQAEEVAGSVATSLPASPTLWPSPTHSPTTFATPTSSPTTVTTVTSLPSPSVTVLPSPLPTATAANAPTLTLANTPTSVLATATPSPQPTVAPATAMPVPSDTPLPAPTPTPPPTAAPTATAVQPVAGEAGLEQYLGCINCHNVHPQQVRMPHPLNPTCNDCHRGSPSRVGCPTCHSMHQVDNRHEPVPDLGCNVCHQ